MQSAKYQIEERYRRVSRAERHPGTEYISPDQIREFLTDKEPILKTLTDDEVVLFYNVWCKENKIQRKVPAELALPDI